MEPIMTMLLGDVRGRSATGIVVNDDTVNVDLTSKKQWFCGIYGPKKVNQSKIQELVNECVAMGCIYLYAIGPSYREVEDIMDNIATKSESMNPDLIVLTTGTESIEEATWELMASADHPDLDDSPDVRFFSFDGPEPLRKIEGIIESIKGGWLPPDST